MSVASDEIRDANSARAVANTYTVAPGIFVLGSLSTGVTVYRQQVRAHNLASALNHLAIAGELRFKEVAVVGGGIGGMTAAAVLVALDPDVRVTLFEKRWDLCPLQQGCDTRWLHPRIYDWPVLGCHVPRSDLPVLGWKEGRASDVASAILKGFAGYCTGSGATAGNPNAPGSNRVRIVLGLSHLSVDSANRRIEWMGHLAERQGSHFRARNPEGDTRQFDAIVVATGFGLEHGHNPDEVQSPGSYWRSDMLGQPALAGTKATYIISGYGDGALVDLCRLTIERFRQDTILEELFGEKLEGVEERMQSVVGNISDKPQRDLKTVVEEAKNELVEQIFAASARLSYRIRKDTTIVLHAQGTRNSPRSMGKIFGYRSAIANRLLLYMLYRAGAFQVRFTSLESVKREFAVSSSGIVQRHGTSAKEVVLDLFTDPAIVETSVDEMKRRNDQSTDRLFRFGSIPATP